MGGHGVVRVELEGHFPHTGRADVIAGDFQHAGELFVDADLIGPGFDGAAQFLDRLFVAAEPVVGCAQISQDVDPFRTLIFQNLEVLQGEAVLPGRVELLGQAPALFVVVWI